MEKILSVHDKIIHSSLPGMQRESVLVCAQFTVRI